jgi:hypothetical protein
MGNVFPNQTPHSALCRYSAVFQSLFEVRHSTPIFVTVLKDGPWLPCYGARGALRVYPYRPCG